MNVMRGARLHQRHFSLRRTLALARLAGATCQAPVIAGVGFSKEDQEVTAATSVSPLMCGEDVLFVAEQASVTCLGVADGVQQWQRHGVDPAMFARRLMHHAHAHARSGVTVDPRELLALAYAAVLGDALVVAGSSTACLATLDHNTRRVRVANLGDSGCALLRDGHVVGATTEQQHYFNAPFQLARVPPGIAALSDLPSAAQACVFEAQPGDILCLATDGVFDNIDAAEIAQRCVPASVRKSTLPTLARELARECVGRGNDAYFHSPFARNAEAAGIFAMGGKRDDAVLLLVQIL